MFLKRRFNGIDVYLQRLCLLGDDKRSMVNERKRERDGMGGVLGVERDGRWLGTKLSYCSALLFSPFHLITSSGPQLF